MVYVPLLYDLANDNTFIGLVLGLGGGGQWRCRLKTTLYTDRNFNCNLVIDSRTC